MFMFITIITFLVDGFFRRNNKVYHGTSKNQIVNVVISEFSICCTLFRRKDLPLSI